jgi:penicillin-binding protein 1C
MVWPLRTVLEARTGDGASLAPAPELKSRRFTDSRAAALVTHVLSDNAARARAFGLENALRLPFPAAAKTGTSKGYSDNWTVGFTHERTVAVWAGNFDGTPMVKVSGITGAGPIFKRVMKAAMEGISGAALVDRTGLESATICPLSGARAGPNCPSAMGELFFVGSAPHESCAMHRSMPDNLPAALAARCEALAEAGGRLVDLGPDYYEWARNEGLAQEPWLAAACLGASSGQGGLKILSPGAGEEFLVLSDLPAADQAIPLRVRASPADGALEVRLDGTKLFSLQPPFTGRLPVTRGEHVLSVHREGEDHPVAQAKYRVREESRL